jgi:hypothetical protein
MSKMFAIACKRTLLRPKKPAVQAIFETESH